ncbi:diguanylate cyclase domain-containing protein [Pseudomonas sp. HMWF032]|uniref:diguanylate cyclase domain-containing protein n=1 Tax=Pseudomonas sp. HMWF032 TaxID=2056866 RepID=UPI0035325396
MLPPATGAQAAAQVAERCRQLIREQNIQHAHSHVGPLLTLSLGVGTPTPGPSDQPQSFLEQVDRLLYKAKHSGRNQAVLASAV